MQHGVGYIRLWVLPNGALALSFRPSLHSGIPLRKVRILRAPTTSDLTTVPLLLTSRFTVSTTSKKTCSHSAVNIHADCCLMPACRPPRPGLSAHVHACGCWMWRCEMSSQPQEALQLLPAKGRICLPVEVH